MGAGSRPALRLHRLAVALRTGLDGSTDQRSVLRPRPVVIADIRVAEELVEHKPGVARAVPGAAVSGDLLLRRRPLALVTPRELPRGVERPVLGDPAGTRGVGGAGDCGQPE